MADDDAGEELSRTLRRRGALILAVAALVWVSFGTSGMATSGAGRVLTAAVAVGATLVAIALAIRSGARPTSQGRPPAGWRRKAGLVNVGQVVAIVLTVVVLEAAGAPRLVPAAICLIVGLHFLPLARLFDQRQYRWTGALLCVTAVAGIIASVGTSSATRSGAVVGIGAAVVLWATSVHVATRG